MTYFVEVHVPRNAKIAKGNVSALAFGLGPKREKISTRLVDPRPHAFKGKTVICRADVGVEPSGERRVQIRLIPTRRKVPTHTGPEIRNGQVLFIPTE